MGQGPYSKSGLDLLFKGKPISNNWAHELGLEHGVKQLNEAFAAGRKDLGDQLVEWLSKQMHDGSLLPVFAKLAELRSQKP